jgi:adenosine deaminase CECR1
MHPLPILLNQGIPVALCSDDPNQFGSMGLSYDFYQVIASSEITGLIMLGEMARDSIKYSRLLDDDKVRATEAWERRWAAYVKELAGLKF